MEYLKATLYALPVAFTFVDVVGFFARVEGVSMQPVLNPEVDIESGEFNDSSDIIFVKRWNYRQYTYNRGDVVAVTSPKDPRVELIKRVIGVEGDVIKTINYKTPYCKVPPGHCWVEGDNTGCSLDSNSLGPIASGLIVGQATRIIWPYNRWQKLESKIPEDREPINLRNKSLLEEIRSKFNL